MLGVWLAFDTDGSTVGYPEVAVGRIGGPYAVYELREMWTFVCQADRRIEEGSYVVRFPATCVHDSPEPRLRSPYEWWFSVGTPPRGAPNFCTPSVNPLIQPPAWCPPYATYTDVIVGTAPISRATTTGVDTRP